MDVAYFCLWFLLFLMVAGAEVEALGAHIVCLSFESFGDGSDKDRLVNVELRERI